MQLIHYQVPGKSLAALHVISFFHRKFVHGHGVYHHQVHIFFEDIHNEYRVILYHTAVILRLGSLLIVSFTFIFKFISSEVREMDLWLSVNGYVR